MREILFRGKQLDNGEWVEGGIIQGVPHELWQNEGRAFILVFPRYLSRTKLIEVDPTTVGQYTGLKDKNGKRIFEGDVVEGHCHSAWRHDLQRCEVAYGRDGFEARHHVNCGEDGWRYYTYRVLFSKDVVVIGNIHDNPELVKDGEDNY